MVFSGQQRRLARLSIPPIVLGWLFAAGVAAQSGVNVSPPPPTPVTAGRGTAPPLSIAQALVPEGVYAAKLAAVLLSNPEQDEAEAEAQLSKLGIEPKYGWISEYPVTPEVLGEIDKDIAQACDQGNIALARDTVMKRVGAVKTGLGLDIGTGPLQTPPPPPRQTAAASKIYHYVDNRGAQYYTDVYDSIPPQYRDKAEIVSQGPASPPPVAVVGDASAAFAPQYAEIPDADAINAYYQDQGPPVVTYYSPPQPFYALYSWVPYAFWSAGYYFPGFFVLNNFRRHVDYGNNRYWVSHQAGPGMTPGHAVSGGEERVWQGAPADRHAAGEWIQRQRSAQRPAPFAENGLPRNGGNGFNRIPQQPVYRQEIYSVPSIVQEQRQFTPPAFRGGAFGGHEGGGVKGGRR